MIDFLIATILMSLIPSKTFAVEPPPPIIIENVILTAYSSSENETDKDPHITASNQEVYEGVVACPRKYPFGTRIFLGDKEFVCQDRMNKRFEKKINEHFDLWMESKEKALEFGVMRGVKLGIELP